MRRSLLTASCFIVALALAGCEMDQQQAEAPPDETAAEPAQPEAAPQPGAAPAGAVRATLDEWTIQLERDTIPAGSATFTVANQGDYTHAFEVEGQGQEWETEDIPSGGQATLTADLEPGTYEVYCPIDDEHGNHQNLGMTTTLVVR